MSSFNEKCPHGQALYLRCPACEVEVYERREKELHAELAAARERIAELERERHPRHKSMLDALRAAEDRERALREAITDAAEQLRNPKHPTNRAEQALAILDAALAASPDAAPAASGVAPPELALSIPRGAAGALSSPAAPAKLTKEWCVAAAEAEAGCEVTAGAKPVHISRPDGVELYVPATHHYSMSECPTWDVDARGTGGCLCQRAAKPDAPDVAELKAALEVSRERLRNIGKPNAPEAKCEPYTLRGEKLCATHGPGSSCPRAAKKEGA